MANLEKLVEVRNAINNFKENFDYALVKVRKDNTVYTERFDSLIKHDCNTCGCIAGFTLAISKLKDCTDVNVASNILDLHPREKSFLFIADDVRENCFTDKILYLKNYDYPDSKKFHYSRCSSEDGVIEALKRLDFMIEHYSQKVSA